MRKLAPVLSAMLALVASACGSDGGAAFTIDDVEYPDTVVSDGARGTLTIYWSGNPTFPVEAQFRPVDGGCPPGLTCESPTQSFSDAASPLVFIDSPRCFGVQEQALFDYELQLTDANGAMTAPYHAPFTCVPQ